jgi:ATP-dependent Clp protease adapter protein ClpS
MGLYKAVVVNDDNDMLVAVRGIAEAFRMTPREAIKTAKLVDENGEYAGEPELFEVAEHRCHVLMTHGLTNRLDLV